MKHLLFFMILCWTSVNSGMAQTNPCGTILPPEARQQLDYARQQATLHPKGQEPIRYIPLRIHIVGTDTGTGYFDAMEAYRLICELNEDYVPVGFHFYVSGQLHYINNSNYYIHDFNAGEDMMDEYNVSGLVNVYLVQDPAGNCGYFSWGGDALAIAKSCAGQGSTTLAHELGHYFFLPHTFRGWEGAFDGSTLVEEPPANEQERVSGSNCASAGDGFCDTPADYLSYRWNCPYNGNLADPSGAQIDPDETLYMSYSSDECQGRFSNEQIDAMQAALTEFRDELIQPQPNTEEPYNTFLYYPPSGTLVIDPDHVLFAWRPVSNADQYLLSVTPNGAGDKVQIYTTDTFYVANLSANTNYTMKLLPLVAGNTCGMVRKITFKTATANMMYVNDLDVLMPNCNGEATGAITFEAAGGTAPYSYVWSNGTAGNTNVNMGSSIYYVTITDANSNTARIRFILPQPNQLEAIADVSDNTVAVTMEGGIPPYTFDWATGSNNNATQGGIPAGNYEMLITDANGCTVMVDYNVTTILSVSQAIANVQIKVYPTLLYGNTDLRITLNGGKFDDAQVAIINTAGQVIHRQTLKNWTANNAALSIPTNALAVGMYWLSIKTEKGTATQKFVVIR